MRLAAFYKRVSFVQNQVPFSVADQSLSKPYFDNEGRRLQLWKHSKYGMICTVVFRDGNSKWIDSTRIHNGLDPAEYGDSLAKKLYGVGRRNWMLAYYKDRIHVWPDLKASGVSWNGVNWSTEHDRIHMADHDITATQSEAKMNRLFNQKDRQSFYPASVGQMTDAKQQILLEYAQVQKPPEIQRNGNQIVQLQITTTGLTEAAYSAQQINGVSYNDIIPYSVMTSLNGMGQTLVVNPITNQFVTAFPNPQYNAPSFIDGRTLPDIPMAFWQTPDMGTQSVYGPNGPQSKFSTVAFRSTDPSQQTFANRLNQNGLTSSYNPLSPSSQVPTAPGSTGEIGGVSQKIGIIEGLSGSWEDLLDKAWVSVFSKYERPPFSEAELGQIIREMANAVINHDQVPFFSLHFNGTLQQYPVMHPVFQDTLVGEVLMYLDYLMKCFLNGRFFPLEYLAEWDARPITDVQELGKKTIEALLRSRTLTFGQIADSLSVASKEEPMVPLLENPSFFGLDGGRVVGNGERHNIRFWVVKNYCNNEKIKLAA